MQSSPPSGSSSSNITPGLHLVSTPIGAARDITLHALDVLARADLLAAEDTRSLRHLMEIHGIALNGRRILACHDHNEAQVTPKVLEALAAGQVVAYASEAGTPLISDPGFGLVRAAAAEGHPVRSAPGASALLAALTVAGLPTDRFLFAGFPPSSGGDRRRFIEALAEEAATLVLYESPRRVIATLGIMAESFGAERRIALCRELTKRHEEVIRGSIAEVLEHLDATDPKGEIVLVIDRAPPREIAAEDIESALRRALETMSVKEAATFVAQTAGVPRRTAYQIALTLDRS